MMLFGLEEERIHHTIGDYPAFRLGAHAAQVLPHFKNTFEEGSDAALLFYLGWRAQRAFDKIQHDKRQSKLWE